MFEVFRRVVFLLFRIIIHTFGVTTTYKAHKYGIVSSNLSSYHKR